MTPKSNRLGREEPHDVLAAEKFGVPAPDPGLHADEPHDVLAAEDFEVGTADPALHHSALQIPNAPDGSSEPHDILAAEEFPVPAGRHAPEQHKHESAPPATSHAQLAAMFAGLSAAAAIALRRRINR